MQVYICYNRNMQNQGQSNKIRPPPNLIELEQKSDIITYAKSPANHTSYPEGKGLNQKEKNKSKTPNINSKKGPNNFFNRPSSGQRKPDFENQFQDLVKIKPSLLQQHRIVKLPKVFVNRKRPETPKIVINKKDPKQKVYQTCNIVKKDDNQNNIKKQIKSKVDAEKKTESNQNIPSNIIEGKKQIPSPQKMFKKPSSIHKERSKKNIGNQKRELKYSVNKVKKPKQEKLQINSEEVKKKMKEKVSKKLIPKRKLSKKSQRKDQEINFQKQFNEDSLLYREQQIPYNSDEISRDPEDSLSLSISKSLMGKPVQNQKLNAILLQMKVVNQMIQKARNSQIRHQGIVQVPQINKEVSNLSESQLRKLSVKNIQETPSQFLDHSQLENMKIWLQQIFGLEEIIFIFHVVEEIFLNQQSSCDEEEIISSIIDGKKGIDESLLREHFELILKIVRLECSSSHISTDQ